MDLCTGVGIEVSQEVKTKMQTESTDKSKNTAGIDALFVLSFPALCGMRQVDPGIDPCIF